MRVSGLADFFVMLCSSLGVMLHPTMTQLGLAGRDHGFLSLLEPRIDRILLIIP